jgi:hypothetical protein
MAEVFKARHRYLGYIRAVKVLHPEVSAEPDTIGRLLTEARALARLRHPAIVEVHDCDVLGETAFIAMEYLPGESLRDWLDRTGGLARDPRLAAAIVAAIGEGLAFAHRHGVVHRDLKPENILLVPDPVDGRRFSLKILDFGLAKVNGEEPLATTRTGCVIGTALYMAPERWRPSQPVDHRSDIYALGCLLFELLCGQPPFCATTEGAIMRAHLLDPPPELTALAPRLPPLFQRLLARMLAKAPDDRHGSVEQVLTELEPILGRDRSTWRKHLRMPAASMVAATADDDTNPDARLVLGLRIALPTLLQAWLPTWFRQRLAAVPRWLRSRPGWAQGLTDRLRIPTWLRKRSGMFRSLGDRIQIPTSLRNRLLISTMRNRVEGWFGDMGFRLAVGGSIIIVAAAVLLTPRPTVTDRRPGPGSAIVAAPPAGRADVSPVQSTDPNVSTAAAGTPAAAVVAAPDSGPAATSGGPTTPWMGRHLYSVRVTSDPPGAQAWVRGEKNARGLTPIDIQLSSPRPRRVQLVAPGFKAATLTISGAQTGRRVHARLAPAGGARRPPSWGR